MLGSVLVTFLLVACCDAQAPWRRDDYISTIWPYTTTHMGEWGADDWCPEGTFAHEFRMKVDIPGEYACDEDNSGVNSVGIKCSAPLCDGSYGNNKWVFSAQGNWGELTTPNSCPHGYVMFGARVRSQAHVDGVDNYGATDLSFRCRHLAKTSLKQTLYGQGQSVGTWGSYRACPRNTAICGISTQVQAVQDRSTGDNTALNAAKFFCCNLPSNCSTLDFIYKDVK